MPNEAFRKFQDLCHEICKVLQILTTTFYLSSNPLEYFPGILHSSVIRAMLPTHSIRIFLSLGQALLDALGNQPLVILPQLFFSRTEQSRCNDWLSDLRKTHSLSLKYCTISFVTPVPYTCILKGALPRICLIIFSSFQPGLSGLSPRTVTKRGLSRNPVMSCHFTEMTANCFRLK